MGEGGPRRLLWESEVWTEAWAMNGVSQWMRKGRVCCAPDLSCTFPSPCLSALLLLSFLWKCYMPSRPSWNVCSSINLPGALSRKHFLPYTPTALVPFPYNTSRCLLYFLVIFTPSLSCPLNLKLIKSRVFLFHLWAPKGSCIPGYLKVLEQIFAAEMNACLTSLFKYVVIQMKLLLWAVPLGTGLTLWLNQNAMVMVPRLISVCHSDRNNRNKQATVLDWQEFGNNCLSSSEGWNELRRTVWIESPAGRALLISHSWAARASDPGFGLMWGSGVKETLMLETKSSEIRIGDSILIWDSVITGGSFEVRQTDLGLDPSWQCYLTHVPSLSLRFLLEKIFCKIVRIKDNVLCSAKMCLFIYLLL